MSKSGKIWIALGVSLVFILVSFSLLVKVVITPEKVRETLLPLAKDALQREVEIGAIDIGIFSGVTISDLRVQKKLTPDDFISVKLVALHYKLLALLTGDVVIDQVLLENPRIEVVRNQDGSFNFTDLIPDKSGEKQQPSKSVVADKAGSAASAVFDLLIRKVTVKDGDLLFVDRMQSPQTPYRYNLQRLNFNAENIQLNKAFPINLSVELNGSKIDLSGRYDVSTQKGDLDLQLDKVDLLQFAPYYRGALPGKLGSGELTLNLEVQLQPEQITSKGKLLLDKFDMRLNDLPQAVLNQAKIALDYSLNFNLQKQKLALSTLLVDFNGAKLGLEGDFDLENKDPELKMALLLDHLDLRSLMDSLPKGVGSDLQSYSLAGQLNGRIDLAGKASDGAKLLQSAELQLLDVQATVAGKRAGLDGTINYRDDNASTRQMVLKMADQRLLLDFNANNVMSDLIRGDFQLTAERLDVNAIIPEAPLPPAVSNGGTKVEHQPTVAEEIGPFDLPLDMTGQMLIGKMIYKQLEMDRVQAVMSLRNNRLRIEPLRADVAGGDIQINADVNLAVRGLQYQGNAKLDQSNLMTLAGGLLPQAQQTVSGLLQVENNFSGRGTIPDTLLRSLQLNGRVQLQRGQIAGSPVLNSISQFLGLADLKVLSFNSLESHYDMRNGLASLTGNLDSSKTRITQKGTVSVDGAVNMTLDTRLAPELMSKLGVKSGLQQVVTDQYGWGVLPLAIQGTLSRPRVGFDSEALQKQAAEKLKQEASQRLLDKLGGDSEQQKPVKQLLEGTLNKLFGN
ncbi:AsmA protein [Malonomonas rubra DSM 5091]|uniref:AsmA protein n=1 Tax=Malonomonas rubra DSM 5091 TaxID=1122189 RepID=A0A1M6DGT0_MALRU|nr:AsmA family protein [Malonomonas rubra]SHI72547.1 AsmA protein [Malonomonas rubra DSM 5091]